MEIKVKEMYVEERPREKAITYGVDSLSNVELIAILLRCGYQGCSAIQLSETLISELDGIANLKKATLEELCAIKGISTTKAIELLCALELSKRINFASLKERPLLNDPVKIANYLKERIGNKQQEYFIVLFLDAKLKLQAEKVLFIGSLTSSVVSVREIFKAAIEQGCAKIIVAHNHPSGDCIPSEQDISITKQIVETATIVGIPLIDHIIVGMDSYFSLKAHHLF